MPLQQQASLSGKQGRFLSFKEKQWNNATWSNIEKRQILWYIYKFKCIDTPNQ